MNHELMLSDFLSKHTIQTLIFLVENACKQVRIEDILVTLFVIVINFTATQNGAMILVQLTVDVAHDGTTTSTTHTDVVLGITTTVEDVLIIITSHEVVDMLIIDYVSSWWIFWTTTHDLDRLWGWSYIE